MFFSCLSYFTPIFLHFKPVLLCFHAPNHSDCVLGSEHMGDLYLVHERLLSDKATYMSGTHPGAT